MSKLILAPLNFINEPNPQNGKVIFGVDSNSNIKLKDENGLLYTVKTNFLKEIGTINYNVINDPAFNNSVLIQNCFNANEMPISLFIKVENQFVSPSNSIPRINSILQIDNLSVTRGALQLSPLSINNDVRLNFQYSSKIQSSLELNFNFYNGNNKDFTAGLIRLYAECSR
jgi:hypothetical protein